MTDKTTASGRTPEACTCDPQLGENVVRFPVHDNGDGVTRCSRCEKPIVPGAPAPIDTTTGQHKDHWVLSEGERAKGFVRPVRHKYVHLKCGVVTRMSQPIAETYAREPKFYGSTFCCGCNNYFPVGEHGEFVWDGESPREKVGT